MSQIHKRVLKDIHDGRINLKRDFGILIEPEEKDYYRVHYILPGPDETPFEGGIYHGMIRLNPNHPHSPPNIHIITPNGRYEYEDYPISNTSRGICTTDTAFHPEHHTPMKNIETFLIGFISLMCDPVYQPHHGGIDSTVVHKKKLAKESIEHIKKDYIVAELFPDFHKNLLNGTYKPPKMGKLNQNTNRTVTKKPTEIQRSIICEIPTQTSTIKKSTGKSKKVDSDSEENIINISDSESEEDVAPKKKSPKKKSSKKIRKKKIVKLSESESCSDSESESEEVSVKKKSAKNIQKKKTKKKKIIQSNDSESERKSESESVSDSESESEESKPKKKPVKKPTGKKSTKNKTTSARKSKK